MISSSKLTAAVVFTAVLALSSSSDASLHASCKLEWDFHVPCSNVSEALVSQIKLWTGDAGCAKGDEKCLYTLLAFTQTKPGNYMIKVLHETPSKHYKDDISFGLSPASQDDTCVVNGFSTSEIWYAVLDYGTNYCNMRNLVTGSRLDKSPGFLEVVDPSECTQYKLADCSKY